MVELRKRPAPAAADPPLRKKSSTAKAKADGPIAAVKKTVQEAVKAVTKSKPKEGDTISLADFGGEIETNDGVKTTLARLVEDSKAGVVLFTYPKASTPGCTTQACLFRDSYEPLTATGLEIYGLSTDSPKSNTTFKTKQNLGYTLLCDPKATLIAAIGLKKSPSGTQRGVFVVDKSGKVLLAEPGSPAGTVDRVKALVKAEDKAAAAVAAEVADTAERVDAKTANL